MNIYTCAYVRIYKQWGSIIRTFAYEDGLMFKSLQIKFMIIIYITLTLCYDWMPLLL